MPSARQSKIWPLSLVGKITATTAVVVALAGLIKGAGDLYERIRDLPTNARERTNVDALKRNFGKPPLVSQPILIKSSSMTVEMVLNVYETGDVFVRYGEYEEWLPFKTPKIVSAPFFRTANAQERTQEGRPEIQSSSPSHDINRPPIQIDIDELKLGGSLEAPVKNSQETIQRSYLVRGLT